MKRIWVAGLAAVLCSLLLLAANPSASPDAQLWEYRNLGKAFYENPDTHLKAVEELKKALDLRPDSIREQINYSLALLRAGQTEQAVADLLKAQKADPKLPYTWFNLGIAYKKAGDYPKAIEQFRGMIALTPNEPAAHYNLGAAYRSQGDSKAALPEFIEAARLNPSLAGPHFQLFGLYQRMGDKESAARERSLFEAAKKRDEGAAVPEDMEWCFYAELYDPPEPRSSAAPVDIKYDDHLLSKEWPATQSHIVLLDSTGSGHADLLAWAPDRMAFYKNGSIETKIPALDGLHGILDVAAGDFDNDGLPDLCVLTASGVQLFHNQGGAFVKAQEIAVSGATKALWLDYDHDYDLDLLLFGPSPVVIRNDGGGKFEVRGGNEFPFVKGHALDAVIFAARGDTAARDVAVTYADHAGVLYQDKLNGKFEACDLAQLPAGARQLASPDLNRDGLLDLVSYSPTPVALLNVASNEDVSARFRTLPHPSLPASPDLADFNDDGRQDYAAFDTAGALHVYTNSSSGDRSTSIQIRGVKNLKLARGAVVETKSGPYYNKQVFLGIPLSFALDGRADLDTVRITWPNGLIQNEPHQKPAALLKIEEAQRLSGSCPMIFTWNGKAFQFITDVLGVAPLGASSGDGHYFPVDHDEYVQIPGSALQPVNGQYQIHITEELHEVSYLDQVRLIAVDHPSAVNVYTNDKFKSPPFPEFRLFGAQSKVHPVKAIGSHGENVTEQLARQDQKYPDDFSRSTAGVAELHSLTLDFGHVAPTNRSVLVLNGWVDWADGSTFLGASQSGKGLVFPYLQVKDAAGRWTTVISDMGIPSGKPKSIAVDLTGKFFSASREVRIVTNLCVYWDEAFLLGDSAAPATRLTNLDAQSANLDFRGFSKAVIDPTRRQPERFLYNQVQEVSNWNPTPGRYTRYGDVGSLVTQIDDRLVIMGSGDELKLSFPSAGLPPLPSGWSRDFLLLVDGWAKDSDPNTAFSASVGPLPFHGMTSYPYPATETFPGDAEHRQYREHYLTRPALKLIRPLAPSAE